VKVHRVAQIIAGPVSRKKAQGDLPVGRCHRSCGRPRITLCLCVQNYGGNKKPKQAYPVVSKSAQNPSLAAAWFALRQCSLAGHTPVYPCVLSDSFSKR
jgi:hypothetical protein